MNGHITIPKDKIEMFCRERHICYLAFFGSVLRDDFGPDSDVDVLVEFEPGRREPYLSRFKTNTGSYACALTVKCYRRG
jgi:hypothetical protein